MLKLQSLPICDRPPHPIYAVYIYPASAGRQGRTRKDNRSGEEKESARSLKETNAGLPSLEALVVLRKIMK